MAKAIMGKRFVASYSGGKDGVFAVYSAIQQGMIPLSLLTTYITAQSRSWFHGVPEPVLENAAESMGIPLRLIKTSGDEYEASFEKALRLAKEQGAEACVFGDIDIDEHIQWCTNRCVSAGVEPVFPLYGQSRKAIIHDFIDNGFTAHFTNIDTSRLNGALLGKPLTKESLSEVEAQGADICGENGEYHTFVSNGPIFKKPVEFSFGEKIENNGCLILPVLCIRGGGAARLDPFVNTGTD